MQQPCQSVRLLDLRCTFKVPTFFFFLLSEQRHGSSVSVGYLKGLTSIWVISSGGNDGFVSEKEGKIGFRRNFSQRASVCVCVYVNDPLW